MPDVGFGQLDAGKPARNPETLNQSLHNTKGLPIQPLLMPVVVIFDLDGVSLLAPTSQSGKNGQRKVSWLASKELVLTMS